MGLAAPRKKTKISHDPNNTNWARSTSGFGHRILSSQGWTPGSFLGAQNAAHSDMFTAASASHIRVIMKDDTLGLGARSKRDPLNEPTGHDAFKGLLGRLNGKSDADLEIDRQKRDNAKLARYAATKWQAVTFISGGLLSQEKIDPIVKSDAQSTQKVHKKDKSSGIDSGRREIPMATTKYADDTKQKKSSFQDENTVNTIKSKDRREKKAKKRKHIEGESIPSINNPDETFMSTAKPSRERRPMGRNVFRGRHIAQKKKSLMDEKSLNEIFMIRS
ncbi:hypothetical protein BO70DRAFT_325214 [Aspergillus heteromorphus CBS 117.55]|uniref:Protein PXR1 n=1 Tax=Aspergillus heteromorphus CBS 117.55 TaxID=1448321 RepID=A0A317UTD7_9EURO|nr:uncharacterized protein BO70DRAFT_325214 [Aspergillus heteromorphus CBS 117.55]PWY64721.1 hypothetical protein BO70DRAFT_325214 [Aspergillus heteromorphus CBS 117.55]